MESLDHLPIKFPELRLNLIEYVRGLSDHHYQQNIWGKIFADNPSFYDDFDQAIHYLYDTLELNNQPEEWLNLIFLNEIEIQLTKYLIQNLEQLFDKYGIKLTDNDYQQKPEWAEMLYSAKNLYQELLKNNQL